MIEYKYYVSGGFLGRGEVRIKKGFGREVMKRLGFATRVNECEEGSYSDR